MDICKKLFENSDEYTTSSVKFGVCMASYYRHNGNSKGYLQNSLQSVISQTATNWHIYLVGDKYEDNYEFEELAKTVPAGKITYINLPTAPERENLTGTNLWRVGGSNAFNYANKLALDDGCDYLLHLDDDDAWSPKKIQILNFIVSLYKDPAFIFHYSTYIGGILPRETKSNIEPNYVPSTSNCIHSSYCAHKSLMQDFKFSGFIPGKTAYTCGDIQFLQHLYQYVERTHAKCVFIPLLLSTHDKEGESMKMITKPECKILNFIEKNTSKSSGLVKQIATTMKGNTFHHHFHILYSLRDLIPKAKAVYTEIGTFNGGSLCLMLQHPSNTAVVSIDPFHLERTNESIVAENIKIFNIHNREVRLTKQFSNNPVFLQKLKEEGFKTDILFIDGDHCYKAVIEDFNNFKEFINPGGFIVFDDYHDDKHSPEVRGAVDDIMKTLTGFRIIGNPFNFESVYPSYLKFMNEFIIQRL